MTATPQTLRFSGDIKIGQWTTKTAFGGYGDAINFADLSITLDGEDIIQVDNGITYFGQAKGLDYQPKPTKVAFTLNELNTALLADYLRGTLSSVSQSATADQTATVTLIKDKWVDIGTMNIDYVTIATLTIDEDFKVDKVLGQVMALTNDAVGEKTVGFDQGVITGNKILIGGNTGPMFWGLKGQVKNHNSGEMGALIIPKVSISPKSALDIIGGKGNQVAKFESMAIVVDGSPLFTFYPDLAMTTVPVPT